VAAERHHSISGDGRPQICDGLVDLGTSPWLLGRSVIADLPLKKKLKKQKANKPCLELNAEERARFLAAFDDEEGFRRYLTETMPKARPAIARDARRLGARRAYGAGMRNDSDAARDYFSRFHRSRDLFLVALETGIRSGDLRHMLRRYVDFAEGWIRFVQQKSLHSDRCKNLRVPFGSPHRGARSPRVRRRLDPVRPLHLDFVELVLTLGW
jgi:hypothetical protein